LADSEYSFATGNTEEFVLGKIALLEEIEGLLIDDPSLEFFLPFILEDLVLAYSLGIKGDNLVIPGKLYNRRVVTTPILKDNLVGDTQTGYKLVKNCFNKLTSETAETIKQVIEEYSENPITRRTLEMFQDKLKANTASNQRKHSHDATEAELGEDDHLDVDLICINIKDAKVDPKQAEINLKAYESKTAQIDKELKSFNTLIKLFSTFFARYKEGLKNAPAVRADLTVSKSLSYTAQEKILELKLQGKHLRTLSKLSEYDNPARRVLNQLSNTIQKASSHLHDIKNLPEAHQVKVHDIMDIIVRAVDLEEAVLEAYIRLPDHDAKTATIGLNEHSQNSQALWDFCLEMETDKKYQMRKENVEFELKQAEADLASRMDKIRSRIYMSYNKSKMIAKQIYMLRNRAGAR
jgi:hypothetical protein